MCDSELFTARTPNDENMIVDRFPPADYNTKSNICTKRAIFTARGAECLCVLLIFFRPMHEQLCETSESCVQLVRLRPIADVMIDV